MTKLDLKSIASALAATHNISTSDAEKFLKVLFEVVVDGLRHDGQVKIKGLGTFKLIGVPERELIDVNSGERITVEARNRISFSPDAVLRDIINKPFTFFDTVVLNEGVVFDDEQDADDNYDDDEQDIEDNILDEPSDTDKTDVTAADKEEPVAEEKSQTADNVTAAETPADETEQPLEENASSEPEKESEPETTAEPDAASDDDKPSSSGEPASIEENEPPVFEVNPTEESVSTEEPVHEDTPTAVNEALKDARNVMDDIESGNLDVDDDEISVHHKENNVRRKMWIIFIIAIMFVAAAAFIFGTCAGGDPFGWFGNDQEVKPDTVYIEKQTAVRESADSICNDSIANDTIQNDSIAVTDSIPTSVATADGGVNPDYYDSIDERVRTGAYQIVGVFKDVVVSRGQTLSSISKAYLGAGMECYVEALNGVTSVQPGDTLKIPDLKWRKKK